jgi:hypothetical protein
MMRRERRRAGVEHHLPERLPHLVAAQPRLAREALADRRPRGGGRALDVQKPLERRPARLLHLLLDARLELGLKGLGRQRSKRHLVVRQQARPRPADQAVRRGDERRLDAVQTWLGQWLTCASWMAFASSK